MFKWQLAVCVAGFAAGLLGCEPEKKNTTLWYQGIPMTFDVQAERYNYDTGYFHKDIKPPYTRDQAFVILLDAEGYYPERGSGRIMDETGVPSHVRAFGVLLAQPDAAGAFAELERRGTPAGKLYGMSGLYLTNRVAFEALLHDYLTRDEQVHIGGERSMRTREIMGGNNITLNIMDGTSPAALKEGARALAEKDAKAGK